MILIGGGNDSKTYAVGDHHGKQFEKLGIIELEAGIIILSRGIRHFELKRI